jgi:two-component system, LytTR family, sensor kinase
MKKLSDLVDIKKLQEIQDKFADATNVAVLICDANGVPLTKASNFTSFCTYVRSSSEGLRRCILSDENVGKMAATNKRPVIHRCHAGLVDFAAPIILREEYLGSILCGQVVMEEHELESIEDNRMNLLELDLHQTELASQFKKLKHKRKSHVKAIADLLFVTANHIVEIGDAYLTKEELANKNEKLIKELQLRSLLEKNLKETQLKVLQSQVNPHFLFNTLNTISRIAYLEQAEQSQHVTYLLAKILRYSLRNIDQLVSLEEEMDHVRSYMVIQQTRYRDKIDMTFEIDKNLKQKNIPIFTIQPIVENAIVHGFEPSGKPIKVSIKAYKEKEKMKIDIFDDGVGIEEAPSTTHSLFPTSKQKSHTTGIGLENVDKRIKHYFGNQWGITKIKRRECGGTLVQIDFPIK